jgi:hypothetical protein
MICSKCGHEIKDNSKFCPNCGQKTNECNDHPVDGILGGKSNKKITKNKSMKYRKGYFILGIIVILIISCTYFFTYINKNKSIDFRKYFPDNTKEIFTYNTYSDSSKALFLTYDQTMEFVKNDGNSNIYKLVKKFTIPGSNENDAKYTNYETYNVNSNNITMIYLINNCLGSVSNKPEIILSNSNKWSDRNNETSSRITGTGMKITTDAGEFKNCIEITSETKYTDGKTIYRKSYYAPNTGLVLVKYPRDMNKDISGNMLTTELVNISPNRTKKSGVLQNKDIIYENKEYNFSLNIPEYWKGKYSVSEGTWAGEAVKTIDFNLTVNGKNYSNIFSILILKKEYGEDYIKESPWKYIDTNNGHVFAYVICGEPNNEILKNKDLLNLLSNMINQDVPQIIKSIKFNDTK